MNEPLNLDVPAEEPVDPLALFEMPTNPNVVPRNPEELAGQLTLADDTAHDGSFRDVYTAKLRSIEAGKAKQEMDEVVKQDRQGIIEAAEAYGTERARAGDAAQLTSAAAMLAAARAAIAIQPTPVEASRTVARSALELQGYQYIAQRYKSMEVFDRNLNEAAEALSLRNLANHKIAELEGKTTFLEKAQHFFGMLVPFGYDYIANKALAKTTGDRNIVDVYGSVQDMRSTFMGMGAEDRVEFINAIAKESLGMFGENKAANIELLRKLADMTRTDAQADLIFNSLGVTDVVGIAHALGTVLRKGAPVVAANKAAGERVAGQMASTDLLNGTKMGGLNEADTMALALSAGKNPYTIDPAAMAGLSPTMQANLRASWDNTMAELENRLISSGRPQVEIEEALANIRASYTKDTNPGIFKATFGEGSEHGQQMEVLWQSPAGIPFASKEAAFEWAKNEGKVLFEVVPKNEAAAFKSADIGDWLVAATDTPDTVPRSPNLLASLKTDPARMDRAFRNAEKQLEFGGEPVEQALIDNFRQAFKAGANSVSARKVLRTIAEQASDPAERLLATTLLERQGFAIDWHKVPVRVSTDMGFGTGAVYEPIADKVAVAFWNISGPKHYLHELVHAHNASVITLALGNPKLAAKHLEPAQIKAAKDLERLTNALKKYTDKKNWAEMAKEGSFYDPALAKFDGAKWKAALEHPAELIAYAMTDESLAKALRNIKLKDLGYGPNEQSVFSRMWNIFKEVLGFRGKDDHALARIYGNHGELVGSISENQRAVLKNLVEADVLLVKDVGKMMRGESFASKDNQRKDIFKALEKELTKTQKALLKDGLSEADRQALLARAEQLKAALKPGVEAPVSPTEEWLVRESRTDPLSFDNIGKYTAQDIESMPWIAVDPKHAASELAVEERVIGVHAEAKTKKDLTNFITPYFKDLSSASKARVKSILEEGDSYSNAGGNTGKEFTYADLAERGFSEAEAAAYFAARQARMMSYHLRNGEMVRSLRAEGMQEVELLASGEKMAGKVHDVESARATIGNTAYSLLKDEPVHITSVVHEDTYKAAQRIVSLKAPIEMKGKWYSTIIMDDTTGKARDINVALGYRPGEFSRIYTDQYFITVKKMKEVDGKLTEVKETVRTAASTREASEYVAAHTKAIQYLDDVSAGRVVPKNLEDDINTMIGRYDDPAEFIRRYDEGELDGYVGMDFHYTRNQEEFLNGSISEAVSNGRLFTSKRSDKLFSVDRDRRNTLDVYESLENEITNISRVANISMWRDAQIRKWMATFGDMVPGRTGNDVADFFSVAGGKFTRGTQEAQFAERTHKYIMRQIGVRSDEEKFYEGITRTMTEKLFTGNEKIEGMGAAIRKSSFLGFIRNVNFNLNLGMFNPAQLLVQANGAATALLLSPLHGMKAAYTFPLLRMALMSDNPEVWAKLAKAEKLSTLGLSNTQEFVKLIRAVRKAGILDNIRSTALWNLEDGALNIFGNYPSKAIKSNTFFFNRGEEFSRVVSFDVARREYMAAHPEMDWTSNAALKSIVVRMDDLTQNMTKANLARFQEGALSIPFQFAQYNIKLAANIMTAIMKGGEGRGFTRTEASKLLLGHIALYGAAGNGLSWIADEVLGNNNEMSPETKTLIGQGAVSWVLDATSKVLTGEGAKVALGSRLGSFDYYQRIAEAAYKDPKDVYSALLGPTMSAAKRIGVIGDVVALWRKNPDLTADDVLEGFAKMGTEQVATLRNAAKAYLFMQHQGKMLDKQGIAMGTMNSNEMLWQALGFQPTVAVDVHNLIKSKKDHSEALDDIAKMILTTQRDIITAQNEGNEKRADEKRKLLQSLFPTNTGDMADVQRRVREKLYPYDTEFQKLLGEYFLKGQTYDRPLIVTEPPRKPYGKE